MTSRVKYASFARQRNPEQDELPWLRIPGLAGIELPRPLVLINGAFDLLHSGHMRLIFAARDKAATLVCALDSDEKIAASKGSDRPILTWVERATTLGFMPIDSVVEIGSDAEMNRLIAALKPDLRVQGVEYKDKPTRYPSIPRMFVREGMKTTDIVERIVKGRI